MIIHFKFSGKTFDLEIIANDSSGSSLILWEYDPVRKGKVFDGNIIPVLYGQIEGENIIWELDSRLPTKVVVRYPIKYDDITVGYNIKALQQYAERFLKLMVFL